MKPLAPAWMVAAALLSGAPCTLAAVETVTAFNSYAVAPYFVDADHGLAHALVERLNDKLAPRYRLSLRQIPRIRLDLSELNKGSAFTGAVLFINPRFVDDAARTRFLWSRPLFTDCNLVISSREAPVDYQGPASLAGLRFGAVRGYRYSVLDELARAGKLVREDSQDELSGLNKVARRRLDLTVVPYTIYSYAVAEQALASQLYVAPRPLQCFSRHILVSRARPGLLRALDLAIEALATDPEWKAALASLHLDLDATARWAAYPSDGVHQP
ncbi:transporter substrate-binding domain-containing protein [Duganella sp. LX20W]|uniref:Transporter substrate-binding domain-containing protein n=1 Tax=Rugamonas brunnea TaxID=2758569 RepID=A0A7W2ETE0_9BURK|nr:transporter substrate-binding domain-containing protein [Rugamonas brunnea]MBA5638273.1 transporter substrate-binding domain-containing protein [Rugamonas brunnea]